MSQLWSEISGTIFGNPELSKQQLAIAYRSMRLADVVTPSKEYFLNKQSGQSVGWRLVGRIAGLATTALLETQKVPFAKPPEFTVSATVSRYALAIATFGVRKDLDRINVDEANIRTLRDNLARTYNRLIYNALVAGRSFAYVATGTVASPTLNFTTSGTPSGNAARRFIRFDVVKLGRLAVQYNIPPMDGQNYAMFTSPSMKEDLELDTAVNGFVDVKKYANSGAEGLMNGEIGSAGGIRFVVDNDAMNVNLVSENIGVGATTNVGFGSGFLCGADALKEAVVQPPHFRVNTNISSDFNNQMGVCWQGLQTWLAEWNFTAHGQGAIIHYTTAANT